MINKGFKEQLARICLMMIMMIFFIFIFTIWLKFGATFFDSVKDLIKTHTIVDNWQIAIGLIGTLLIFFVFIFLGGFLTRKAFNFMVSKVKD